MSVDTKKKELIGDLANAVRRCIVRAVAQLSFPNPPYRFVQQVTIPVMLQPDEALARPDPRGYVGCAALTQGRTGRGIRAELVTRLPHRHPA